MKNFLLSLIVAFTAASCACAQGSIGTVRTESRLTKAYPMKRSVNPVLGFASENRVVEHLPHLPPSIEPAIPGPSTLSIDYGKAVATSAFQVQVGRNFEGTQLYGGTPSDNTIAISNSGLIVVMDNNSYGCFKENGDTIVKFGMPLSRFYSDSTMNRAPFDPRIIYDSYEDRFIAVSIYRSTFFKDSRILLSFSKPLAGDTVEWNHYQIHCDSVFTGAEEGMYWFDYPNIAITKSQLVVATQVSEHDTNANSNSDVSNALFQVEKASGYNGAGALNMTEWKNIENSEGEKNILLVPAGSALQSISYDTLVYLVSNYSGSSTKFFWFELSGAVGSPAAQITSHSNFTAFYYAPPSYASQMGGNGTDRIRVIDCDIQYCLFQNDKLHFVFIRSDNGWAELVYATIDISSNAFNASTFGGDGTNENCLLPSIASFGADSTDENFLIAFLRTGPNIFPEVCVINYDSGWSAAATVVKQGQGVIDLRADLVTPWDSMERWGDYTAIQRRYDDPQRRCWMVGAYPFGANPNHFGVSNGVNAWIAEVGDSLPPQNTNAGLGSTEFTLYPNPSEGSGSVFLKLPHPIKGSYVIWDACGRTSLSSAFSGKSVEIPLHKLQGGMYFVSIFTNGKLYGTKKLVVHD